MDTATKVIGALRASGLVDTIPGSGTIVRHQNEPAAGTTRRARLTQREIVQVGMRIADADGLPFVTMRRVADSLGVSTMALYRHVPNKQDLTLQMTDSVFAAVRLPDIPSRPGGPASTRPRTCSGRYSAATRGPPRCSR
jgi:Bacterial regulatory proteins, tetR family